MKPVSVVFMSFALTASLLGSSASMAETVPAKVADGVLTGPNGMTLYVTDWDKATPGKSACNGGCAANWPPLMATDADKGSADYSVITRDDGAKQWAYKGKPLYFWKKDAKPGDKTGEGIANVWHAATP